MTSGLRLSRTDLLIESQPNLVFSRKGYCLQKSHLKPAQFLSVLEQALQSMREKVLFGDERGFQGALLHELNGRLGRGVLPTDPIIQQEYQKRIRDHGIKIRPDIIVHIPFERGLARRRDEGNFVAIELKRRATAKQAEHAFASLSLIKRILKYPLTIFINLDSKETHVTLCPRNIAKQTACFAVWLQEGEPVVKAERRSVRPRKKVGNE